MVASRSISRGLARTEPAVSDTLIAFAAKAGSIADDGNGPHSPFTAALLKHLALPGLDLRRIFGRVRDEVLKSTGNRQEPYMSGSLGGNLVSLVDGIPERDPGRFRNEAAQAWEAAKDMTSPTVFEEFIRRYGDSFYASLARARLAELKKSQVAVVTTPARPVTPPTPVQPAVGVFPSSNCTDCPEMVVVPSGRFLMGSPANEVGRISNEGPQHVVSVKSFEIGKFEVTQAQWIAVMGSNPSDFKGESLPVENVSWDDAQTFIQKLNAKTGRRYRLPTEAEWEYATRAGSTTAYSFGNDDSQLGQYVWFTVNSQNKTHPVGEKLPNSFGLSDMHGNVWEWTADCYTDSYNGAPSDGSARKSGDCSRRVLRGGSWLFNPWVFRSAVRFSFIPGFRYNYLVGFRVARTLKRSQVAVVAPPAAQPATPTSPVQPAVGIFPSGNCTDCPEMVVTPSGRFLMGSPTNEVGRNSVEGPQHMVSVRSFEMGKFEVTQKQWIAVMGSNPSVFKGNSLPVENVSWEDAQLFIRKLNAKTGKRYRLPTESEWEYAARAGSTTVYSFGSDASQLARYAWFDTNKTHPVGEKLANSFGLHDMHGNVWEWTADCYTESYNGVPSDGSAQTSGVCGRRVLRGGSWSNFPGNLRSAVRSWNGRGFRNYSNVYGFRVARTLVPP